MNNQDYDRGMMKYMPYKSLTEQASILSRMRYERNKRPRPHISSDRAEEINDILVHYEGETVEAEYYEDGYLHTIVEPITKIDVMWKCLLFGRKRIEFVNLINLRIA